MPEGSCQVCTGETKNTHERRPLAPDLRHPRGSASSVTHPNTADQDTASHLVQNEHDAVFPSRLSGRHVIHRRRQEYQKANVSSQPSLVSIGTDLMFLSAH